MIIEYILGLLLLAGQVWHEWRHRRHENEVRESLGRLHAAMPNGKHTEARSDG